MDHYPSQLFMDIARYDEYSSEAKIEYLTTLLNSLDVLIYVSDLETYELLFVNDYGQKTWGKPQVKQCFEYLQAGQHQPCSFCTNKLLLDAEGKPKGVHVWEFQNTVNQRWYQCRDQAIHWIDGRYVRLEIAVDITVSKELEQKLRDAKQKAETLARIDPLTNAYNRRAFFENVPRALEGALRKVTPFCLVMVDIDHFKQLNDVYGHKKGDEALTSLIEIMKINARASDLLYRFGGDEFVMVLLDCTDEQAAELIHRIRVGLAASSIRSGSTNILLTCSFGISQARPDSTIESLMHEADEALYAGKSEGRDRVKLYRNLKNVRLEDTL